MTPFEWLSVGASGLAALGTIMASVVALWLAQSSQRVKLKTFLGVRESVGPQGQATFVLFDVTNIGERPVTIASIGWRIGKKKGDRRQCLIPLTGPPGDRVPKTIAHGERAFFVVLAKGSEMWIPDFVAQFVNDVSESSIRTLRGQVHTSVGHTETVVPEGNFVDELRALRESS